MPPLWIPRVEVGGVSGVEVLVIAGLEHGVGGVGSICALAGVVGDAGRSMGDGGATVAAVGRHCSRIGGATSWCWWCWWLIPARFLLVILGVAGALPRGKVEGAAASAARIVGASGTGGWWLVVLAVLGEAGVISMCGTFLSTSR